MQLEVSKKITWVLVQCSFKHNLSFNKTILKSFIKNLLVLYMVYILYYNNPLNPVLDDSYFLHYLFNLAGWGVVIDISPILPFNGDTEKSSSSSKASPNIP